MAFSTSQTQIMDKVAISGGGTNNSSDFTLSSGHVGGDLQVYASHGGTPASGDTIDVYLQRKGDPDNDGTSEYANQGDYLCTLDLNSDDPANKSIPLFALVQGAAYRLTTVNNDTDTTITVSALLTEEIWS